MKKTLMILAVGALVVTVGIAAYAQYGDYYRGRGMYGPRGGGMMYGPQGGGYGPKGGMMYGNGPGWGMGRGGGMHGRGRGGRWNNSGDVTCPCGGGYGRWNGPAQQQQQGTLPEMLSEEKIKETAQEYLGKYLSGYSIDKIEKDEWRPLYFVTVKAENDAVQKMIVHGFSGQIMHVYPKETVEETPAE
jgi:hypothetical protein